MAQLERLPRQVNASTSLSALRVSGGELSSKGLPTSPGPNSPLSEDESGTPHKKSVLSKVKEKAKKLRHSLSKKKHDDGNVTPTWGASLEHDDWLEEDAEYLGAPMYESELAPEAYKENARQHPRATPVIADNHVLHNHLKSIAAMDHQRPLGIVAESKRTTHHHHPALATSSLGSIKTMSGIRAEKLAPAYMKGSDAGLCIPSKMQGLTISRPLDPQTHLASSSLKSPLSVLTTASSPRTPPANTVSKLSPVASKAPRLSSAPSTPRKSSPSASSAVGVKNATILTGEQTWDRGLSVREYFKNKLEPGEDEKALSQVISEAMSSRRTPGDVGVMEKVKEAVTSLLRNEEPSQSYSVRGPTTRMSESPVLHSSNVNQQVGEEESHGRILQTN